MEKPAEDENKKVGNGCNKVTDFLFNWAENLTSIDLSNQKIFEFDKKIIFPRNLLDIDISHNELKEVPKALINLTKIKKLDISFNSLNYFDEIPSFCHTIETLNVSSNKLLAPPYWIWTENPKKLLNINLSNNISITTSLNDEHFRHILQFKTQISDIKLYNCKLNKHMEILNTFPKAKYIQAGIDDFNCLSSNNLDEIPSKGLENCFNLSVLNVSNMKIFVINSSIDLLKLLTKINISQNLITSLPQEFGNLENLEICIISHNSLMNLPDSMVKLKKLKWLRVDSNELSNLPEDLNKLESLELLDIYNNSLTNMPWKLLNLQKIDFSQNYFEDPDDQIYIQKRENLRLTLQINDRISKKKEISPSESIHSSDTTEDEAYLLSIRSNDTDTHIEYASNSSEDWDSDEYWTPNSNLHIQHIQQPKSSWLNFVKRKINEGSFCPMDAHIPSVWEKIRSEKLSNPEHKYESDGQFDDLTDDDS